MLLGKKTQDVWILIQIIFPRAPTHKSHRISSLLTRILLHIADKYTDNTEGGNRLCSLS